MFTLHPHRAQGQVRTSKAIASQTSFNFGFIFLIKGVIPILVPSSKTSIFGFSNKKIKMGKCKKQKKQKHLMKMIMTTITKKRIMITIAKNKNKRMTIRKRPLRPLPKTIAKILGKEKDWGNHR
jgi:hypothetical protein